MAERGKPWHVCDDCLEPLAGELFSLAQRFRVHFDVAKRDRLDSEYAKTIKTAGYDTKRLTENQQRRLDELSQQMESQTKPPRSFDVDSLYRQYSIDLATDWLKFNVSAEYGDDFKRTLLDAKKRFSELEFKACQIINGDLGKESTIQVHYAIERLIDRHYELLRKAFPNHEYHLDRDELPDDLRAFKIEILDEYTNVENGFRETAKYLKRVSALVRSKLAKSQRPEGSNLIERLLAGPDDAELTPRELALLEAHLKQPISLAAIQQEKQVTGESETNAKRNKLKLIRDFNRNLQGANTPFLKPDPAKKLLDLTEGVQAWDYDDEDPVETAVGKQPELAKSTGNELYFAFDSLKRDFQENAVHGYRGAYCFGDGKILMFGCGEPIDPLEEDGPMISSTKEIVWLDELNSLIERAGVLLFQLPSLGTENIKRRHFIRQHKSGFLGWAAYLATGMGQMHTQEHPQGKQRVWIDDVARASANSISYLMSHVVSQAAHREDNAATAELKPAKENVGGPKVEGTIEQSRSGTGSIWSVEDYYRLKKLYEEQGAVFNPALEKGSPATRHVITQHKLHEALDKAKAAPDQQSRATGNSGQPSKQPEPASDITETETATRKPKRSTERGEGRVKLIGALTLHHKYADGSCLNLEHIGSNELARVAEVSVSTASDFFRKEFQGHANYRAICGDTTRLVAALKLLNQEFAPHHLFGSKPAGEDGREDEE